MPRVSRGPHLYLKRREDGEAFWYIRDGKQRHATGCHQIDSQGARAALEAYIGRSRAPSLGDGDPHKVSVTSVIGLYAQDIAPGLARPEEAATRLMRLDEFFGRMTVAEVTPSSCNAFVRWRCHQGPPSHAEPPRRDRAIKPQSARRELADLQSALNHAWESRKLLVAVPVEKPDAAPPRERWLTRSEAARLLWGALGFTMVQATDVRTRAMFWKPWGRSPERINRHAARFVLIGLRTGTRHEAILGLGWHQHLQGGWIDLDRGLIYRKPGQQAETSKRRPPTPIAKRLMRHLRAWHRNDKGRLLVVTWDGSQMQKVRRAFASAKRLGGFEDADPVTPHVLRHTFVTWHIQNGTTIWRTAALAGMSPKMVEETYGHHAPDYLRHDLDAVR